MLQQHQQAQAHKGTGQLPELPLSCIHAHALSCALPVLTKCVCVQTRVCLCVPAHKREHPDLQTAHTRARPHR